MAKNKESKAVSTEVVGDEENEKRSVKPSAAMLALFNKPINDKVKLERRNLPQLIKPAMVPIGGVVAGVVKSIVESPGQDIDGFCLWLIMEDGSEYIFPATGVVRNALAPKIRKEEKEKLRKKLEENIGRLLVAKRLESQYDKKYKKEMFVFDVYTADPPKKSG